jgi:hypothetical protein
MKSQFLEIADRIVNKTRNLLDTRFCKRNYRSRDSVVGVASGYGLDGQGSGVRVPIKAKFFSSSRLPDLGPHSLLSNGYCEIFHGGKAAGV